MRSLLLTMLLATAPALAQTDDTGQARAERRDVATERTAGFSWFSPGGSWGDVTNRRVYLAGIRRSWVIRATDRLAIAYAAELVPVAVVERTEANSSNCWFNDAGQYVCRIDRSARLAAGAGGSPIGMRVYLNDGGRWRAQATGAFGAIMFSSEMPVQDSHILNFTVEYGGGIELGTGAGSHVTLGFRFYHFSNGYLGRFNPGLDANVVYLGWVTRTQR